MNGIVHRYRWVVLSFAAVVAIVWTWRVYETEKDAAQDAYQSLAQCEQVAADLNRLRGAPRVASLEVEPPDRIAARVTSAALKASLPSFAITSVDPQAASRIGRTAYLSRATQLVLTDVTLVQIAQFATALQDESEGMVVRDLSLSSRENRGDDEVERWDTRLTLTQMIYSPISDSSR